MKKKKEKGFTLVELLAALVILGLLTAIAAPNIVGILQGTKLNTYVQDAEKIKTLAEYKFRSDSSIKKPQLGECIIMTMKYLGTSEFKNPPYGGSYDKASDRSYVVIINDSASLTSTIKYRYYIQLVEENTKKNEGDATTYSGVKEMDYNKIKSDAPTSFVQTSIADSSTTQITTSTPTSINYVDDGGNTKTCSVKARYVE